MSSRTFALVWGIVFLGLAATGLVPGLLHPAEHHNVTVDAMEGNALGMFPVNILHTGVHLLFGIWGLVASRSWSAAKSYARVVAVVYGLFVVMGLVPALDTTFGLVPLFGNDVWLHLVLALGGAYFGFMHRDTVTTDRR